ncbi:MAG TPA: Mut7-C RNAse domain-containing protein [Vicinamibacterales bacterium]|nr:Mut7-C RNAse domain-containing protein [Vicinamibacterales bacterium]
MRKSTCEFRFYEELNDYLPSGQRKRSITREITGTPSVKDAIEAMGVPHTEIDLILVDGRSVRFDCRLEGGERVAVYPEFERFDITPLHRLRPEPLREPRFVADVHLGTLARFLRLLGFDTHYGNDLSDEELAHLTARQRRILLTRDVGLLKRKVVVRGQWLRSRDPEQQLGELVEALDLRRAFRPFTRCMTCNGVLGVIARAEVSGLVPPRVYRRFRAFKQCRECARVYWRGTHYLRLQRLVKQVRSPIR